MGLKAQLKEGSAGQFDVLADGQLVAGRQSVGLLRRLLGESGMPDPAAVVGALRERMQG